MSTVRLGLARYLADRLAPLAVLVFVTTCLSAPVAFYVLGRATLEVRAGVTAREVASLIRRDVQERPVLWKYDSAKILEHATTYEMPGVEHIVVVDNGGQLIEGSNQDLTYLRELDAVWRSADVQINRDRMGQVWVAASAGELRRDALVLLIGFSALGLVLAGLLYGIPIRAIRKAEHDLRDLVARLRESQGALESLAATLEQQVDARSTQLREALRELQQKEQNLRTISQRAIKLQESERRGIARELHDSAGQALTAIRLQLQLLGDLLTKSDGPTGKNAKLARRTLGMVDDTVEEIRRAVNQLGPAVLDDVGLEAAIRRAVDDLAEATAVDVEFDYVGADELDASIETTTYRIVQESLTNIARHADASEVFVRVEVDADALRLSVADNGAGFELSQVGTKRRGLVGMRERVELLGGELMLDSARGGGTTVRARLPHVTSVDDEDTIGEPGA